MVKFQDMEHDEPTWRTWRRARRATHLDFNRAGEFEFACLIAGHYQAGMVGKLIVAA